MSNSKPRRDAYPWAVGMRIATYGMMPYGIPDPKDGGLIVRLTQTAIITDQNNKAWRRSSGILPRSSPWRSHGSGWRQPHAVPMTPELQAMIAAIETLALSGPQS